MMDVTSASLNTSGFYSTTVPPPPFSPAADKVLAVFYVLMTIIGTPGNILAAVYFIGETIREGRETMVSWLYSIVTVTDVLICITHLPHAVSLFNNRDPVLFASPVFCAAWAQLFISLQTLAVFLVLLLSVTRTLVITNPFYRLSKRAVIAAPLVYMCYLSLETGVVVLLFSFYYQPPYAYCYAWSDTHSVNLVFDLLVILTLGAPAVGVFVSFVVSLKGLHKTRRESSVEKRETNQRDELKVQASITVLLFTCLYMICNVPHFLNFLAYMITMASSGWPGPIYQPGFMWNYSWGISNILSVVLNSALNPVIYWCRVHRFQEWVCGLVGVGGSHPSSVVTNSSNTALDRQPTAATVVWKSNDTVINIAPTEMIVIKNRRFELGPI